ncbi:hypothetical protein [Halodesulfurarchaeum sp.]|uniref:hypothetical protein n=1 Tax=Halodesulfurarchaeum sp. TaxID=1980530 RepID=UPI002FC32355
MTLSRRRLLAATSIGAATVLGFPAVSSRALAYPETTTVGDAPSAQISWRETYNGAVVDSSDAGGGPVLDVSNAQPGDSGTVAFSVTPDTETSIRTWFSLAVTANDENGRNEPERKAGDETPDRGELADAIKTTVWFDTGSFGVSSFGGCNGTRSPGETVVYDGSLTGAGAALGDGVLLADERECLSGDEGVCVGVAWSLPESAENRIQGDGVSTSLSFTVESCGES